MLSYDPHIPSSSPRFKDVTDDEMKAFREKQNQALAAFVTDSPTRTTTEIEERLREAQVSPVGLTLPTDSNERKEYPLFRGVLRYFPAALAGVAKTSKAGNDKHNPGQELHHARGKSTDHADCIIRHLMDASDLLAAYERGTVSEKEVLNEVNQLAWRALAFSQELHERFGSPLAPGAK